MFKLQTRLTMVLMLGAAAPTSVFAQSAAGALNSAQAETQNLFARDRSSSVLSRARPDYEARGLPAGAFTLYPRVQVDVEANDNIFAVSSGAQDDVVFRFKPDVALESNWSRHALSAYANAVVSRYQDYDSENADDWTVGARGRIDVTRSTIIDGGAEYADLTEPRTNSNTAVSARDPIQYNLSQAFIAGATTRGRLKLSARADTKTYDYEDGRTIGGAVIDQDDRDRTNTSGTLRADYAISPATAFFVQASANARDYDTATSALLPQRDSSGGDYLAGVNFEVGALAVGEIAVGYITQDFDAVQYRDIDGFGARAELEWYPTELTTVSANASRTVEDSGIAGAGGYLSTSFGARVDHELMRNVLLNAAATLSNDEYEGIDRTDDRKQVSAGVTYLVNRALGVSASFNHLEQDSSGARAGVDFTVNRLGVSLVAQF